MTDLTTAAQPRCVACGGPAIAWVARDTGNWNSSIDARVWYCAIHAPNPDPPQGVKRLREQLRERTEMIEELLWAMHLWGQDEDESIHPDSLPRSDDAAAPGGN